MISPLRLVKYITIDLILDILYFPFWWYTKGLKKIFIFIKDKIRDLSHALAIKILLIHLLKPMFGQYDRAGRLISFFMRCVQLLIRLFLFILGFIGLILLLGIWVVLPIFTLYQIINLIT